MSGEAEPAVGGEAVGTPGEQNGNGVGVGAEKEDLPGQPSGRTVFVMNIPTHMMFTLEDELKLIFGQYGEIKSVKQTGIQVDGSNCPDITLSAYIHFSSTEAADNSMQEQGRNMGGNALDMFVLKTGPNFVVAESLPVTIRTDCIKNLLQACGSIKGVVKIPGRRTAFIEFEDEEGAKKALSLHTKLMVNNVKIMIEKRDANSKPVVGHKPRPVPPKAEVRRPVKRAGGPWGRGGMQGQGPPPPPQNFRGANFRGRARPARGYRGFAPNYWGNNEFNSNDQVMGKRRKPNDWIRQY